MGAGIRETPTTFFSSRSRSMKKPRFSFSTLSFPRRVEAGRWGSGNLSGQQGRNVG